MLHGVSKRCANLAGFPVNATSKTEWPTPYLLESSFLPSEALGRGAAQGGSGHIKGSVQGLNKEVVAPHDRLPYAESLVEVIDSFPENSLPFNGLGS